MFAAGSTLAIAVLTATAVAAPAQAAATDKVEKQLRTELATKGSTQFLVYLKDKADLSKAGQSAGTAKTEYVFNQLTATASKSQAGLTAMLKSANVAYKSYWIANALTVTGDQKVADAIAARPEVTKVAAIKSRPLITPTETRPASAVNAVEWGLSNINAPQVWSQFGVRGEGIVVANIDTGVDFDHPAVVGKYRGNLGGGSFDHNYNWFDPSQVCGTPSLVPCDNNNHGTHTMGTMVGDDGAGNQIGVAPGARWIAAKGCEARTCSDAALLAAGQWVLAPTDLAGANPRPDLRPDIVNNSWGGGPGDPWYQATVQAWVAAGIMPIFSSGNDGPACLTAGSPGDYPEAYSTGGYDINNNIYTFSGRGTGLGGITKPNLSAPAVNVRSSINGGGYAEFTGTSMAAPHLSGTVALMWSAAPSLRGNIAATRQILDDTARDHVADGCGGTTDFNNDWGEGRLDALAAVTQSPRGPVGRVSGVVTNAATGAPLAGATVAAGTVTTSSAPDGSYSLTLAAGSYTITASKYGFSTVSAAVTVTEGGAVTQNFALAPQAAVTVSGKVLDGSGHGWPLYAKLQVNGTPLGTIYTNPVTGAYSFTVPGGATYSVTATAVYPGYLAETVEVVAGTTNVTQNISLDVNPVTCNAPGYAVNLSSPLLSEDFDGTPSGWTVVKRSASGAQWAFDDPGARGNLTGGDGGFAIADSDFAGSGTVTDTDLVTPVLNFTGVASPSLRFNSDFRDVGTEDFTDVDVTTDGGATWTNVYHQDASRRGPTVEEVALTPAANQSAVQLRFHYFGTWDWWWEIDNVRVVNRSCDPVAGGLVVGFTTDSLAGTPLNGVTVTSNDNPADKGVSAATPDDPNIPDGFYWLFSSLTGSHPFTASKAPYTSATKSVNVAANSTTQADFALTASRLTVTPTKIESFQTLGQTRSTTVTVKNTGNGPAQVDLFERGGTFDLLSRQGAPLQVIPVPGGGSPTMVPKGPYGIAQRQSTPVFDDAWTQIDNTPVPVSDNAAAWVAGKVYSVGGGSSTGNEKKLMVYDPATEDWTTLADMPHARSKPQAANLGDKLYVFGGWAAGGTPEATVDVYDPEAGSWSTLGATNPNARSAAGIAVIDDAVYLIGGCTNGGCTVSATTVKFDPAGETFSTVAAYPHDVAFVACGGIGGNAYCAGGVSTVTGSFTDGFAYDPDSDAWTPIAAMPVDLWGSQEAAANGMLMLAGGYTNNSAAITNRTVGYDPAANAWVDLPNANFARVRGAGACGAYKIGGWVSDFTPSAESEALGGLDQCAAAADVPWLSENPESFTLAPGASRKVTVTLAATNAAGVFQPGDYTAEIAVRSNSPYPVSSVDVTMHVLPPANWGKVSGTITGLGCAGTVPLPAQLEITLASNPDVSYALKAKADGTYAIWLPKGKYDIIVSKDGWRSQSKRHQVKAGFAEVLDFSLRPFVACPTRAGGV